MRRGPSRGGTAPLVGTRSVPFSGLITDARRRGKPAATPREFEGTSRRSGVRLRRRDNPHQSHFSAVEPGHFALRKFEQPIRGQTSGIRRDDDSLAAKIDFQFTDRGAAVRLATAL